MHTMCCTPQLSRLLNCTGRVHIVLGKHLAISIVSKARGYTGGGASNGWPSSDHILLGRSNDVRMDYMSAEIGC